MVATGALSQGSVLRSVFLAILVFVAGKAISARIDAPQDKKILSQRVAKLERLYPDHEVVVYKRPLNGLEFYVSRTLPVFPMDPNCSAIRCAFPRQRETLEGHDRGILLKLPARLFCPFIIVKPYRPLRSALILVEDEEPPPRAIENVRALFQGLPLRIDVVRFTGSASKKRAERTLPPWQAALEASVPNLETRVIQGNPASDLPEIAADHDLVIQKRETQSGKPGPLSLLLLRTLPSPVMLWGQQTGRPSPCARPRRGTFWPPQSLSPVNAKKWRSGMRTFCTNVPILVMSAAVLVMAFAGWAFPNGSVPEDVGDDETLQILSSLREGADSDALPMPGFCATVPATEALGPAQEGRNHRPQEQALPTVRLFLSTLLRSHPPIGPPL